MLRNEMKGRVRQRWQTTKEEGRTVYGGTREGRVCRRLFFVDSCENRSVFNTGFELNPFFVFITVSSSPVTEHSTGTGIDASSVISRSDADSVQEVYLLHIYIFTTLKNPFFHLFL